MAVISVWSEKSLEIIIAIYSTIVIRVPLAGLDILLATSFLKMQIME